MIPVQRSFGLRDVMCSLEKTKTMTLRTLRTAQERTYENAGPCMLFASVISTQEPSNAAVMTLHTFIRCPQCHMILFRILIGVHARLLDDRRPLVDLGLQVPAQGFGRRGLL